MELNHHLCGNERHSNASFTVRLASSVKVEPVGVCPCPSLQ